MTKFVTEQAMSCSISIFWIKNHCWTHHLQSNSLLLFHICQYFWLSQMDVVTHSSSMIFMTYFRKSLVEIEYLFLTLKCGNQFAIFFCISPQISSDNLDNTLTMPAVPMYGISDLKYLSYIRESWYTNEHTFQQHTWYKVPNSSVVWISIAFALLLHPRR